MANKETGAVPDVSMPLAGTELIHVVQGGNSRKATVAEIHSGAMTVYYTETEINELLAGISGSQNRLISGGAVAWESGLTFRVSAARYQIGATTYSSPESTVTLGAADATNPRIDVIAVNTAGAVVVIPGTAAASPSEPDVDPSTQLKLTFVLIAAAATAPAGVTIENIYLENTEWTSSVSGSGFNANSLTNPYAGTKTIEGTTVANGAYVRLERGAGSISLDNYALLRLFVRSKATWASGRVLRAQFFLNGVAKGNPVTIASGYWGFDSSITANYQFLGIPVGQFLLPAGTLVNQLRITDVGGSIGFYIDNITLQSTTEAIGPAPSTIYAPYLLTIEAVTGTAYTLDASDVWRHLRFTNAAAVALTVPANATVSIPIGARIRCTQAGAGVVTLTPAAGVTLRSRGAALASAGQFAVFEIEKVATDEWDCLGDLA